MMEYCWSLMLEVDIFSIVKTDCVVIIQILSALKPVSHNLTFTYLSFDEQKF